jgi:hypothetical protein
LCVSLHRRRRRHHRWRHRPQHLDADDDGRGAAARRELLEERGRGADGRAAAYTERRVVARDLEEQRGAARAGDDVLRPDETKMKRREVGCCGSTMRS